jgi:hypothetical protein
MSRDTGPRAAAVEFSDGHVMPAANAPCPLYCRYRTTMREIEACLCQEVFRGALKQRRGRGRSVVVGFGSDLSEVPVSGCKPAALD